MTGRWWKVTGIHVDRKRAPLGQLLVGPKVDDRAQPEASQRLDVGW